MNGTLSHRRTAEGRLLSTLHAEDSIEQRLAPVKEYTRPPTPQTQDGFTAAIEEHYQCAREAGMDHDPDVPFSLEDARNWYLSMMPMLTSRRSVQLYIAIAAYGRQTNLLTQLDVKHCLYVAQLALAAFGTRNEGPEARLLELHGEAE